MAGYLHVYHEHISKTLNLISTQLGKQQNVCAWHYKVLHCSSWHYESRPLHHEIIDMHKWQWFRMRLLIRIVLDIPVRHLQMTDVPVPAGVPKHDRQLFVSKAFFSTACALILELPFTLHHKNTQISRYLTEMPSPVLPPSTIITLNKSLNSKPSMTIKCKQFFFFLKKKKMFCKFCLIE